jgi:hypothetical protein
MYMGAGEGMEDVIWRVPVESGGLGLQVERDFFLKEEDNETTKP